jgi:hypothetical protein
MRIEILPIDFMGQGALLEPANRDLHDKAVEYCASELEGGKDLNLAKFTKAWVVLENGEVCGIFGFVWRIDIPVFRVTGERVDYKTQKCIDRIRDYFTDQGARGSDLFIHISSKERPEQRCEKWKESLDYAGATPADRFSVKI